MNSHYIVLMFGLAIGWLVGRMWKFWVEDKKLQKAHKAFLTSDRQCMEMMKAAREAQRLAVLAIAQRDCLLVKFGGINSLHEKETIN